MSKELEHLEVLKDWANEHHNFKEVCGHSIPIEEALERLEQIENANPNEALKILETLADDGLLNKEVGAISYNQIWLKNQIEVLKQALLKSQEQEKVLKIVFGKNVDISLLKASSTLEQYNGKLVIVYGRWLFKDRQLTQEEFDLLKRNY